MYNAEQLSQQKQKRAKVSWTGAFDSISPKALFTLIKTRSGRRRSTVAFSFSPFSSLSSARVPCCGIGDLGKCNATGMLGPFFPFAGSQCFTWSFGPPSHSSGIFTAGIYAGRLWRTVETSRIHLSPSFPYVHTRGSRRRRGFSSHKNERMWTLDETSTMNDKRLLPDLRRYLGTICRTCSVIEMRFSLSGGFVIRYTRRHGKRKPIFSKTNVSVKCGRRPHSKMHPKKVRQALCLHAPRYSKKS